MELTGGVEAAKPPYTHVFLQHVATFPQRTSDDVCLSAAVLHSPMPGATYNTASRANNFCQHMILIVCMYNTAATTFNGGMLAAVSSALYLYRDVVGCGACFQVRCKDRELCGAADARVVPSW